MGKFTIGLVKPVRLGVYKATILANDKAWRTAIFGMGGSKRRLGGARIGQVGPSPLAVIVELPEMVPPETPVWTIETDAGVWGFAGPGAIYNDAGFGPATLCLSLEELRKRVTFDPDPADLEEALRKTLPLYPLHLPTASS